MILIKLGGSIITNKEKPLSPRKTTIEKISKNLRKISEPIIVVHGGGSYGHYWSVKYDMHTKEKKYDANGVSIVKNSMIDLNKLILNSFQSNKLNPYCLPPTDFMMGNKPIIKKIKEIKKIATSCNLPLSNATTRSTARPPMNETTAALTGSVRRPSSAFTMDCTEEPTPAAKMKNAKAKNCMRPPLLDWPELRAVTDYSPWARVNPSSLPHTRSFSRCTHGATPATRAASARSVSSGRSAPSARAKNRARKRPVGSKAGAAFGHTTVPLLSIIFRVSSCPARAESLAPSSAGAISDCRKRSRPTTRALPTSRSRASPLVQRA